ncbi:MAG: hypothetical protein H0A74_00810 [Candidatus Vesicomyosocius endoextente]|uniref:Uncharacterized protein n=1 Tax=Candidatus Vesicomyosocius endoextente TaxID=2738853 RepID=A0A853G770_9GAMM|nr:hypothetical protein [Candidatus Vesicomyosocius endoextente]
MFYCLVSYQLTQDKKGKNEYSYVVTDQLSSMLAAGCIISSKAIKLSDYQSIGTILLLV